MSIESGKTEIETTGVKYTFALAASESFQKNGKLLIIFPDDFTFTSSSSLTCGSSTSSSTTYSCSLNYQARLLTLYFGSSFTTSSSISFYVSGITNPSYATASGSILIRSYKYDSSAYGSYTLIETSVDTLTITPTVGTLSSGK